jgi:MoxR-like ATPase
MKKLVPESIEETLQIKRGKILNEGVVDWLNTTKNLIKGVFKKIGNFFVGFYKDKPVPAVVPANIGIMYKEGKLPKAVRFIPSQADIDLEPSLSGLKGGQTILDRVRKGYLEDAAKNKARGKLKENLVMPSIRRKLSEAKIPLKYTTGVTADKIRNVHSEFLVKRLLLQVRNPKLMPPLLWGAPGIGKTAITKAVVQSLGPGHRVIDVQTSKMAPDDWTLPAIINVTDTTTKEAIDIPKNWLPVYQPVEGNPEENARLNDIANWGEGGIIFLDELSRAIEEVQNTCLKLVLERMIGDRVLGSKWAIIAATNREEDDPEGGQTKIGSALANRFQHFNFVPTVDEWIEWARGKKIDDRIITFIDFNRDHFYLFDNEVRVNTTPRTWEALSDMLAACQEYGDIVWSRADMEDMLGGTINSSTVEALAAFLTLLESFRPEEIKFIFTNLEKAPKLKSKGKSGTGFDIPQANALIGAACSQSKDMVLKPKELENYVQYFINLGDASLAAKALWLIVETHPYIHQETGDIKGKEKYKPAMDLFRKAFGGIKFGKREDVMGS